MGKRNEIDLFILPRLPLAIKIFSFSHSLRRLTETGIMDRQMKVFRTPKPKCIRNIQAADLTVDMTAIFPALLLLFCGILLSFTTLAFEILIHRAEIYHPTEQRR